MIAADAPKPRRVRWILACALIVLAGLWLWRRHAAEAARPPVAAPPVPVTAAEAAHQDVEIALSGLGTVTPVSTVTVASRVAGVLMEADFREGQEVKRGDLLAVIDPRPYQAAVLQAQGQLARDQAVLANARIDVERYRTAFLQHAIPEQQVATQEAVVREDEGLVQLDQGSLDAAQVNLDYTRITSPIDGRVGLRQIDPGNIVPANGAGGLVTVAQMEPITVVFTLAEDYLGQVAGALRGGPPLAVEASGRGRAGAPERGQLLTIDNQVDQATGTIRLKASFPNQDRALWPGEFVEVRLVTGSRKDAVTVPARAVQSGPNGTFLFVIKPDSTVEMRTVEVAQTDRGTAAIAKGLAAGERVVVDGQYRLEAGAKVAVRPGSAGGD